MLTVRLEYDSELECPADFDCNWKLYSFCRRHASFKDPEQLGLSDSLNADGEPDVEDGELRAKLENGLAHFLSYYEHGNCLWFRKGGSYPAGVEFCWDGVRVAGLLVWEHKEDEIGGKTYDERAADADGFLRTYTAWANGEGYYYCIEDENEEHISSCGGFYGGDEEYFLSDVAHYLVGKDFEVTGDAAHLEDELRRAVAKLAAEKATQPA